VNENLFLWDCTPEGCLPQGKLFECMEVIKKTTVKLPVKRYDVIVANVCGTGVDIVATKDVF
jgi:CxxC motif-containing protein